MKRRHRSLFGKAFRWSVLVVPALLVSASLQAVTLTGIEHAPTPTGGLQLQIQADGPLPPAKAFLISDPPRLVVDLSAVGSSIAERTQQIASGPAQSVTVV